MIMSCNSNGHGGTCENSLLTWVNTRRMLEASQWEPVPGREKNQNRPWEHGHLRASYQKEGSGEVSGKPRPFSQNERRFWERGWSITTLNIRQRPSSLSPLKKPDWASETGDHHSDCRDGGTQSEMCRIRWWCIASGPHWAVWDWEVTP